MDIIRHWLNVKQGSCQAMGNQWNSHCGVEESRTIRQINGGWGWIFSRGFLGGMIERREERGSRLNF